MTDPRPLRSFGRIKARALKPRQAGLMETLLPLLALPESGAIDLEQLFQPVQGPNLAPLILEIGFGGGEHLVAQAAAHPRARFIGVEPFLNGVASCLRHVEDLKSLPSMGGRGQDEGSALDELGRSGSPVAQEAQRPLTPPSPPGRGERAPALPNIRLHQGDARDVVARLPDDCLDLVYILFPDPWPKARHHKRRLVQPDFIGELARALKRGGEVRFATDWANYAEWTLERFPRDARFTWTAERAMDWRKPWAGHVTTRYEAKKLGDCQPVWLRFGRR